ncbi:hypothetical protein C8F01DRAFT_1118658 [Mycena amicta]|nr:hypothetical protein C8F01DRAFT_1118658 [Mycena amicta]
MSYYEPFGNSSQPPTPRDNYQWDQQTQPAESQHSDPQQSQSSLDQQQLVTPTQLHPTLPHLEEPQHPVPTQRPFRGAYDMTPVRLHPPTGRSPPVEIQPVILKVDTSARPTARPAARPHQNSYHPYQRPSSAAGRREVEAHQHIRFPSQASTPQAHPGSALHSPAPGRQTQTFTSPLSEYAPLTQQGSSSSFVSNSSHGASTEGAVVPFLPAAPAPAPAPLPDARRYLIRADTHYDPATRVITALLEVPGVKKHDLTITLATTLFNRLRQVTVQGRSHAPFPPSASASAIRERKYGLFTRNFPVPLDTRPGDIDATMEDGVLVLKIHCGFPAPSAEQHEIPIR